MRGVYFRDFDLDPGDLGGDISWLEPLDTRLVMQYAAGLQSSRNWRLNQGSHVDSIYDLIWIYIYIYLIIYIYGHMDYIVDSIIQYDLLHGFKQRTHGFHEDPWDLPNGHDDFQWKQSDFVNEIVDFSRKNGDLIRTNPMDFNGTSSI